MAPSAPLPYAFQIDSLGDPRVAPYRNLRERNLRAEGVFMVEGALLAQRLLHSRFPVKSLFVTPENAARFAQLLADLPAPRPPLYVAPASLMREIAGFDFHRGVLALGRRLPLPTAKECVERALQNKAHARFLACPATETAENLGLIFRSAAAFGIDGVLLSGEGADPFSRRCLRQSMGASLTLPLAVADNLLDDLRCLRQQHNLPLVAAVSESEGAVSLSDFEFPPSLFLVMGHEYRGLDDDWISQCDYQVTIPIAPSCDSLNVAVATGILLFQMRHGSK